jgi:2-octaprenyl-6-methoxyphenol hydroxylase
LPGFFCLRDSEPPLAWKPETIYGFCMPRKKTPSQTCDADVIIVGGGLAGLTLAALLGTRKASVICIDREPVPSTRAATFDLRTTAISYGSHLVLKEAGVWDLVKGGACPIEDIRILDGGSPVLLNFLSQDLDGQPFGWIVNNLDLRRALHQRLEKLPSVTHLAPAIVQGFEVNRDHAVVTLADGQTLSTKLIVGADGKNSSVRKFMKAPLHGWMYGQSAIVCVVAHENPHHHMAIEHFRPEGPFAVLPMTDAEDGTHRSSLVWTVEGSGAAQLAYDDLTFNAALNARFPAEYGEVRALGPRAAWPLGLQHVHTYIAPRMALVAEAAHVLHPIAGQGLNMGLRDIAELATLIGQEASDPGSDTMLKTYQTRRHFDNMAMLAATDTLNKLFSSRLPLVSPLRKLGVALVQACPPARRFFMRQAMGTAGLVPEMMKKNG